jgi:hypothetical protein
VCDDDKEGLRASHPDRAAASLLCRFQSVLLIFICVTTLKPRGFLFVWQFRQTKKQIGIFEYISDASGRKSCGSIGYSQMQIQHLNDMSLAHPRSTKRERARLCVGQVVWRFRKGARTKCVVRKRNDGRMVTREQTYTSRGRPPCNPAGAINTTTVSNRIGGRIHCFWWSPERSLKEGASKQMRQWCDVGFKVVLWSYKQYPIGIDGASSVMRLTCTRARVFMTCGRSCLCSM